MIPELVDKHRYINMDYYWWDCIYGDYIERLEKIGWTVDAKDINFSGFCSQGNGASFTGYCHPTDLEKFLTALGGEYPFIRLLLKHDGEVRLEVVRRSHSYVHSNTAHVNLGHDTFDQVVEANRSEVRDAVIANWNDALYPELEQLEAAAQEHLRGIMNELYVSLEAEYDALTSDEAVWETIKANDLHLNEEN